MCLSSLRFTLKLNCSGKGNSPSVSNDSELAWGAYTQRETKRLHQMMLEVPRVQWEGGYGKGCWHISLHRGCKPFKTAADSFSSRVLLQQCRCQTRGDVAQPGYCRLLQSVKVSRAGYRGTMMGWYTLRQSWLEARGMKPDKIQEQRTFCSGVWRRGNRGQLGDV